MSSAGEEDATKRCGRCGSTLPLASFVGIDYWCRLCRKAYNHDYQLKHKERLRLRENFNKRRLARRRRAKAQIKRRTKDVGVPLSPHDEAQRRHTIRQQRKQGKRKTWNRECQEWRKKNRERRHAHQRRYAARKRSGLAGPPPSPPAGSARILQTPPTSSQPSTFLVWPHGALDPVFRSPDLPGAQEWAAHNGYVVTDTP